jgi:hypothetical protein
MDKAYYYLQEAESYMSLIVDVSLADAFFESTDDVKDTIANNQKATTGAMGAIRNAFRAIIDAIKKLLERFTDFIKTGFMSKERREQYKEFRQAVAADPELANTRVTIKDFKEYEANYDKALKELDALAAQDSDESKEETDKKVNVILQALEETVKDSAAGAVDTAKKAATRGATSLSIKAALELADGNATVAKAIKLALDKEIIKLEDIEKELGEKNAAKFEKKINNYARNGIIHRAKVFVLRKKQNSFMSVAKSQLDTLLSYTNVSKGTDGKLKKADGKAIINKDSIINGAISHPKLTSDIVGGPKNAANIALATYKSKRASEKAKKQFDNTLNDLKNFVGVGKNKK